ncbi:MAG: hypothetical protein NVSMB60_07770 [Mycobacterium sp.]
MPGVPVRGGGGGGGLTVSGVVIRWARRTRGSDSMISTLWPSSRIQPCLVKSVRLAPSISSLKSLNREAKTLDQPIRNPLDSANGAAYTAMSGRTMASSSTGW